MKIIKLATIIITVIFLNSCANNLIKAESFRNHKNYKQAIICYDKEMVSRSE